MKKVDWRWTSRWKAFVFKESMKMLTKFEILFVQIVDWQSNDRETGEFESHHRSSDFEHWIGNERDMCKTGPKKSFTELKEKKSVLFFWKRLEMIPIFGTWQVLGVWVRLRNQAPDDGVEHFNLLKAQKKQEWIRSNTRWFTCLIGRELFTESLFH